MAPPLSSKISPGLRYLHSFSSLSQCYANASLRAIPANNPKLPLHLIQQPSVLSQHAQLARSFLPPRYFASKARPTSQSKIPIKHSPPRTRTPATTTTAAPPFLHANNTHPIAPFAHTLATKPSPTLLYLAPTSNTYTLICLGVGALSTTYGIWHLYDAYFVPHPGLWWLIPHLMAGVSVFMIGVGVWIGLGARRLVGSLTAVPTHLAGAQTQQLVLRMQTRRALPFLAPKMLDAPLSDVHLNALVAPIAAGVEMAPSGASSFYKDVSGSVGPGGLQRRRPLPPGTLRRVQQAQQARERENETLWRTITGPPRKLLGAVWRGVGRVAAREGFATVRFAGKNWKLDARDGWLLDEGVALDRLLGGGR